MALSNGHVEAQDKPISAAQHLGKRKRTPTPEVEPQKKVSKSLVQEGLTDALRIIRQHDPSDLVLRYPLAAQGEDGRAIKKQKTENSNEEGDNVQARFAGAAYTSIDSLIEDIIQIRSAISDISSQSDESIESSSVTNEQITIILDSLSELKSRIKRSQSSTSPKTNGSSSVDDKPPALSQCQVLSLRSSTEHGSRQLFSGLPKDVDARPTSADGRRLPNGFELMEVLTVDKNNVQNKDTRKFGEIFAPHRNSKSLEMPKGGRLTTGNSLSFVAPFENISTANRNDYKFANLVPGYWLQYAISDKAKPDSGNLKTSGPTRSSTLFKAAFSSFAPSTDSSHSVVNDLERSQQWEKVHGGLTAEVYPLSSSVDVNFWQRIDDVEKISDQDLEDMVTNFIPEEEEVTEETSVLDDISELIEMLESYQSIRNLEVARGPSSASKASKDEQNTYDLLRDQLRLLVSSLPPFAVSKLNGDQLDRLNISTTILVSPPEFVGTGQSDDFTLRRSRAVQAATTAAVRTPAPIPSRNTYSTPVSAYNAQARAYNNVPNSAYTARPPNVPMYSTPQSSANLQGGSFRQTQYRPNGPIVHTPSIQQFQRPTINGYGTASVPLPQSPYMQRPVHSNYAQRPQESTAYGRTDTSQKAVVNGDSAHYQQRQPSISNNQVPLNLDPQRSANEIATQQRQSSGTPQPRAEVSEEAITAAS